MGITLTAAQCVIFGELYWNPGHLVQAEDRAHRLGQQGCVQVRYLIAPGTIDDAMWPLLGKKLQVVGKALDGNATGSATGLHISDASSLATYIPSDRQQPSSAVSSAADTNSPASLGQQPPTHPQTSSTLRHATSAASTVQKATAERQSTPLNGQSTPVNGQVASVNGQQRATLAHQGPSSGQKRPSSVQSLLQKVQANKRVKQTTLDMGFNPTAKAQSVDPGRSEREPQSARRQSRLANGHTPYADGQHSAYHQQIEPRTQFTASASAKEPLNSRSPYGNVAQVLDLTDSENDTGGGQDAGPIEQCSNAAAVGRASKASQLRCIESSGEPSDKQPDSCIDLT